MAPTPGLSPESEQIETFSDQILVDVDKSHDAHNQAPETIADRWDVEIKSNKYKERPTLYRDQHLAKVVRQKWFDGPVPVEARYGEHVQHEGHYLQETKEGEGGGKLEVLYRVDDVSRDGKHE